MKFDLDATTSEPARVGTYQLLDTNRMVEELMLLANQSVATYILRSFPRMAVLRKHPPPPPDRLAPLVGAARAAGFPHFDVSSSKRLSQSLESAIRGDDAYFNTLLRIIATRCMTQAVYLCTQELENESSSNHLLVDLDHPDLEKVDPALALDPEQEQEQEEQQEQEQQLRLRGIPAEVAHYGLAMPLYTHFTSPIRRYADVLVHRLLDAALERERRRRRRRSSLLSSSVSLSLPPGGEWEKKKKKNEEEEEEEEEEEDNKRVLLGYREQGLREVVENMNDRHRQAQVR